MEFAKVWHEEAAGPLRRADPLLMGAAFAYNALFALVPLAVAFASLLTLFEFSREILADLIELMEEELPVEVSGFLVQIITESVVAADDYRTVIILVAIPIAMWSGSRAVFTVQKALRLLDDSGEDVGYVRMRSTGILVTLGAGVGIIVAYFIVTLGGRVSSFITEELGQQTQNLVETVTLVVAVAWIFSLVYAVYRWGGPRPIPRTVLTSAIVTGLVFFGSRLAIVLMPTSAPASLAVFGTIGVVLLWQYAIGIVVVGVPIVTGTLTAVLDSGRAR